MVNSSSNPILSLLFSFEGDIDIHL